MQSTERFESSVSRGQKIRAIFCDEDFTHPNHPIGCIEPRLLEQCFIRQRRNETLDVMLAGFDKVAPLFETVYGKLGKSLVKLNADLDPNNDIVRSVVFLKPEKVPDARHRVHLEYALSLIETSQGIFGERHLDELSSETHEGYIFGQEPLRPADLSVFEDAQLIRVLDPSLIGHLAAA